MWQSSRRAFGPKQSSVVPSCIAIGEAANQLPIGHEEIRTSRLDIDGGNLAINAGRPSFASVLSGSHSNKQGTSFAAILNGTSIPAPVTNDNQNVPVRKGNFISVRVNNDAYKERIALCQFSLIARIVYLRGEKPWKYDDLFLKLQSIWQLSKWKLIHLGRGYFHVLLHSEEDRKRVWSQGSLNLKPGIVHLQAWVKNFNPAAQKSTNAQVWVKFHNLSWEYWHSHILFDLARGIGVPLRIAEATLSGNFGYFARVLVDVDLAVFISEKLLLETEDICIEVQLEYENCPDFCTSCRSIGHPVGRCRMIQRRVPPMAKPSEKGKDESKPPTQTQRPKPPTSSHKLGISQGQSSGLYAENPYELPQTEILTTGLNVSGTQVSTPVTVATEIVVMDLDEEHSVPKNIIGTSVQEATSDLGDTFDELDDEMLPMGLGLRPISTAMIVYDPDIALSETWI